MRDKITGCNEYENANQQSGNVQENNQGNIHLHRDRVHIIGGWVEFDNSCDSLQQNDADSKNITDEKAFSNDENGKPEERMSHCFVLGT